MDLVETGHLARRHGDERGENSRAGDRTEHTTDEDEERLFDQELADQIPSAAADRRADTELIGARRTPVQQQTGKIGAGNEQQQYDSTRDDGERRRHVADDTVGERDDGDAARWVIAALVAFRVFQCKCSRNVLHLRTRRRQAYAGLEPPDSIETRVVPAVLHAAVVRGRLWLEQ